jgi:hypothetical protein
MTEITAGQPKPSRTCGVRDAKTESLHLKHNITLQGDELRAIIRSKLTGAQHLSGTGECGNCSLMSRCQTRRKFPRPVDGHRPE